MDNNVTTTTNTTPLMEDDGTVIEHIDQDGNTVKVEDTTASVNEENTESTSADDSKQSETTQNNDTKNEESTETVSAPTTDSGTVEDKKVETPSQPEETVKEESTPINNEESHDVANDSSTTETTEVKETTDTQSTDTITDSTSKPTEEITVQPYVSFGVPSKDKETILINRIKKANLLSELKKTEDGEYIIGPYNSLEDAYQARKQVIRKGLRGKIIEF